MVITAPGFEAVFDLARCADLLCLAPDRLTFAMRGADLWTWSSPIPLQPLQIEQAWHARNHRDPAHVWFRARVRAGDAQDHPGDVRRRVAGQPRRRRTAAWYGDFTRELTRKSAMLSMLAECDAAEAGLPAVRQSSSHDLQWRSVLARTYLEKPNVDEFTTLPTNNLLFVVVTGGMYAIDELSDGRWSSTVYRPGSTGITAPGSASTLRWRTVAKQPLTSLQVYLSPELFTGIRSEGDEGALAVLPDALAVDDPVITTVGRALGWALESEVTSLYADSAAQFLAAHVVERHLACRARSLGRGLGAKALTAVVAYMQDNLADDVTLDQLAAVAGLSKHHFLRSFKTATGVTPHNFLVEMRMQRASELLSVPTSTVSSVARPMRLPKSQSLRSDLPSASR